MKLNYRRQRTPQGRGACILGQWRGVAGAQRYKGLQVEAFWLSFIT